MKRISRTVTHVANQLTDAHPTQVSLVEHGANQTPFKVVKTDHIMTPETQRFVFKKDKYADAAAVTTYLTAKGFTDAAVTEVGETFVAVFKEEDQFSEVKEVACEEGVSQFVGALKEAEAPAQKTEAPAPVPERQRTPVTTATVQPVAKSLVFRAPEGSDQEAVKRYDSWVAYYEGHTSLADAIAAGITSDKGAPVGFDSMMETGRIVIKNNFGAGTPENIPAVCAELAAALLKLHGLWAVAKAEKSEGAEKVAKALFAPEENPSVETPPTVPTQKTEVTPETPPAQSEADAKPAVKTEEPVVPETPADPAEAAVTKAIGLFTAKMEELLAPVKKGLEEVQKRVEEVEAPTRKSADHTEIPNAGEKMLEKPATEAPKQVSKGWDNGSGVR